MELQDDQMKIYLNEIRVDDLKIFTISYMTILFEITFLTNEVKYANLDRLLIIYYYRFLQK